TFTNIQNSLSACNLLGAVDDSTAGDLSLCVAASAAISSGIPTLVVEVNGPGGSKESVTVALPTPTAILAENAILDNTWALENELQARHAGSVHRLKNSKVASVKYAPLAHGTKNARDATKVLEPRGGCVDSESLTCITRTTTETFYLGSVTPTPEPPTETCVDSEGFTCSTKTTVITIWNRNVATATAKHGHHTGPVAIIARQESIAEESMGREMVKLNLFDSSFSSSLIPTSYVSLAVDSTQTEDVSPTPLQSAAVFTVTTTTAMTVWGGDCFQPTTMATIKKET
ncbi:MAG: hypothetical protein M1834_002511, partial [Cirrosporium novae-zelandiae]